MGQISDPREEPSVEVPGEQQQRSSMASSLREQIEDEELEILPHTAEMRSGCANARTKEESEAAEELPPVEPYTPISSLSEGSASKEEQRADDAADVTAHSATSEESDAKKKEAEVEAVDSPRPSAPPTPVGGPREFTASVFSEQKEEAYVVVPTSDKGIEDRLRGASVAQSENSLSAVPLTPGDEAQQPASGAESHQDRLDQIEGAEEQMLNSSVAPPSVHNAPVEEPEVERSAHEVDAVDAPAVADAARFELPSESPSSLETSAESTETSDKAEDAEAAQAVPVALTVSVSQQLSNHSASQLLDEEEPHSTTSEAIDASEPPLPAQEAAPEQDGSNEHVTAALRAAAAALCDDSLAFMPAPTPLLVIENEKEKVKEGETQVELPSVDSASNGALETPPAGSDLVQEQSDAQEAHEKRAGDAHDAAAIAETSARKMDDEGPAVPREPAEIETGEERHEMSSPSEGASVASEKEEEMSEAAAAPALDEDARRPVLSPLDYTAESFEASEHALKPSEDVERPFDEEDMKEQESEAVAVTQPPVMPLHGEISELTEGEFSGTASLVAFASEAGAVEGVAAAPEASAPPDPLDEPTPSPLPPYPSTNEGGPFVPHEAPEAPSYHCTIEAAEEEVEEDASFHADGVAPHAHEGDEHQLSADVVDTSSDVDEIELSSSAIASEQEEEVAEHPQTPSPASTPAQEAETLHGISMPTGSESALSADAPPSSTGSDYTVNAFAKHASASSCIDEGDAPAHENEAEGEMLDLKGVGVPSADPPAAATAPEGCDEEREDMDFTPTASSHDDLPALVAEGVPSPFGNAEDENEHFVDTEDLGGGKHTAAPKMGVDDWEEELSALPAATTPETSDDEEAETLHMALNSGRDLLDRRRGVEEEVQDDDFDF
ncbi:hypothetical protein ABL78_2530 [Leptomonas seymouri]|uniref:Uncharacterized protein n=1 Tax=Leptomonas seymouri TaxID=5684 RepID=A0A0N1ILU6_LEPSE|nr:hypothetical protein ABL78_2530 [Leptomonas seymouri]|eukprot:KPI88355.1 hypothetical protein ABL78_2530 [Leptomonas seymouri]